MDLVYLDPPFNSNRSYNVIFAHHDVYEGDEAAQIQAFAAMLTSHFREHGQTQHDASVVLRFAGIAPAR